MTFTVGSLFAGIGGFDLGFERVGFKTAWQVEIDPYCQKVLAKNFPHAERYADIRECGVHNLKPVDVICGGFPCQDISNAGLRAGIGGERSGLWREMHRIISELRPRYVVVENVAALLVRGFDRVLGDLSEIGYDAEWQVISAADVGAPHLRKRIWIVAYPESQQWKRRGYSRSGRSGLADSSEVLADTERIGQPRPGMLVNASHSATDEEGQTSDAFDVRFRSQWAVEPNVGRVVARLSPRVDGGRLNGPSGSGGTTEILQALQNGIRSPQIQWPTGGLGRIQTQEVLLAEVCKYTGKTKPLGNVSLESKEAQAIIMRGVWFDGTTACSSCRRAASEQRAHKHPDTVCLLSQLLTCDCGSAWLDPTGTPSESSRADRLRSLGNAVVPQIPELIARRIFAALQQEKECQLVS